MAASGNNTAQIVKSAQIIKLPNAAVSRRVDIVKRVRASVEKKLFSLMAGLSENVADALFEEMRHLDEQAALECHFNIMRALKVNADVLCHNLHTQMNHSWIALIHRRDEQAVDDAPYDVIGVLKGHSDKNLNHYKILLEELRLRFSHLSEVELSFHPLLPGNFYLSFWHATECLGLTYQERRLVMPLFNRFVMDRFGQILSIANQTLVELDIPAWIDN